MKETEVSVQFRMREKTHAKLKIIASSQLRSLNSQIEFFAIEGIKKYEDENGEINYTAENESI
ncbi:MAG: hypothetical protein FWG87_01465 [Defluviitaleaceae bacterium]|nr:hypothetical protein [Defluviitaleaceae bacterium]